MADTKPTYEELAEALTEARRFITNGIETGHIRMPRSADDPAHKTLGKLHSLSFRCRMGEKENG